MPVARVNSISSIDPMKSIGKPEEGNDSLDNFIRQAIGKEPVNSFSRASDGPVQWIQLLHALDQQGNNKISKGSKINSAVDGKSHSIERCNGVSSFASETNGVKDSIHPIKGSGVPVKGTKSASEQMQALKIPEAVVAFAQAAAKANGEPEKYLPGWPLLSPPKVQMQKCDKCNREFCSPINYRRHIRVHRRSLNIDKDFSKNRDFLGAYWDKISLDEAKEIVSFNNLKLEDVPGSSIVKALVSFIRKPGFSSLPQVYVKAGATLLDIVQTKPSRFPIPSKELFSILDDASEKTFLCAGTALSLQKFVFDGEAGKIGLEMRNLVACTSFLLEQKLVEAWLADKDAEALRCQKLLVEEEEAAQKRQAELLEKKRLKKLRQKEQKAKELLLDGENYAAIKEGSLYSLEGVGPATSSMLPPSDYHSNTQESAFVSGHLSLEPVKLVNINEVDGRCDSEFDDALVDMASGNTNSTHYQHVDHRQQQGGGRWRRSVSSPRRIAPNGFHSVQIQPFSKLCHVQKHGNHRDQRATTVVNGHKVWTRKMKADNEGEDSRLERELRDQMDEKESEVLIGSISVMLGDCNGSQGDILHGLTHQFSPDHQPEPIRSKIAQVLVKSDSLHSGTNRMRLKLWRPVGKQEAGNSIMVASNNQREANSSRDYGETAEQSARNEGFVYCSTINDCSSAVNRTDSATWSEVADPRLFCSRAAEAFLIQRWKEAVASDHVKLELAPEADPPDCVETQDDGQLPSGCCISSIICNGDNRVSSLDLVELAALGANKLKFRGKGEKGGRLKYIPKQRNNT